MRSASTGEASDSAQFNQSGFKYDYQELRFTATVPAGAESLSFDLAFLTKEYPIWKDRPYNDMFVGWIESEKWTGNVSFDLQGNALSLNAAFLELYDDAGDLPEFAGTCMRYSAGTRWLTTTADVVPGETIELVLAIFDGTLALAGSTHASVSEPPDFAGKTPIWPPGSANAATRG